MKDRNKAIPAAHLILKKDEKVLLIRRFNTGYADGQYSLPAGHVDKDELPIDATIRETAEEIGIRVKKSDLAFCHCMYMSQWDSTGDRLQLFFETDTWAGEIENKEPHKCDDILWCDISSLPNTMIPYIRSAIEAAERGMRYSEI